MDLVSDLWFAAVGLVMLGVAVIRPQVVRRWHARRSIKRVLTAAPPRTVAESRDGAPARLVGVAELIAAPMFAPITDRPCMYFAALRERYVGKGGWIKERAWSAGMPFVLRDRTGTVVIDPGSAAIVLEPDVERPEPLDRKRRALEQVIEPGDRIAVVGMRRGDRVIATAITDDARLFAVAATDPIDEVVR